MELIKREQVPTETGRKLYDLLVKSWKHGDFVYGVLMRLRGDKKKQQLIDFIEADNTDSDDITLESLAIAGIIERK